MVPRRHRRETGKGVRLLELCESTPQELAYAAELDARDTADWNAQWVVMSAAEQHELARHELDHPSEDVDGAWPEDADCAGVAVAEWVERVGAGTAGAVSAAELVEIAAGNPHDEVFPLDLIAQLQATDRLAGWVASRQHAIVAALCPPDDDRAGSYLAEQHLMEEVQVARRCGPGAARTSIDTARALSTVFTATWCALADGDIHDWHARALVAETARVSDDPAVAGTVGVCRDQKLLLSRPGCCTGPGWRPWGRSGTPSPPRSARSTPKVKPTAGRGPSTSGGSGPVPTPTE